jgi:hypothetical protein
MKWAAHVVHIGNKKQHERPTHRRILLKLTAEKRSLTFREEHRLMAFQNRVLRRIFGPKKEEDRSWKKLHNDELHNLYSSLNIVRVIKSRRMRWVGHVAQMGKGRGIYSVLVGRPDSKRSLGRPRNGWEDNIKMDLRETGINGAN